MSLPQNAKAYSPPVTGESGLTESGGPGKSPLDGQFHPGPGSRRSKARLKLAITFGARSAEQVLAGKKTLTFRKWPKARVKVGEEYDAARMGYPPSKFARIRVTGLRRIRLGEIDDKLARRDGSSSSTEVKAYWSKQGFKAGDELWLVEFELA